MVVRQALVRTGLTLLVVGALVFGLPALLAWTSDSSEAGTTEHAPLPVDSPELVIGLAGFLLVPGALLFVLFLLYGRWRETTTAR
ncbi:hypothetical protein [Aeromicrobium sp. IC_218]|uniref:hypothetical protein n=1 Tax=Aeromicrobium sp. IC_218 TaxID=2545468 RepID=UPI00103AAA43|nr:hypothetical protein [Aeromicrobium sp. IC_218]TCI99199.1 hypothetical protein E0W78_08365 [Aeromicrobium sp. IC_218]